MSDQDAIRLLRSLVAASLKKNGFSGSINRLMSANVPFPILADLHITSARALTIGLYWGHSTTSLKEWTGRGYEKCIKAEAWIYWLIGPEKDGVLSTSTDTFYRRTDITEAEVRHKATIVTGLILEVEKLMAAINTEIELADLIDKRLAKAFPYSP
ncbi:MAG: hypothetical protein IT206_04455 [Fimbriimonadaceae bacterium]|nr:hypothetical protein [Fimbriimonadaceae bacterium]